MPESAVLRKFRDSGPPTMAQAAQFEDTAPRAYAPTSIVAERPLAVVSNPRLYREVFGFAFASSLGDPTIGYPSWNFSLLSTVAYFGIHVDWTGDFSGGSALNTWNDPYGPVPGFIRTAHANGTKVVLTIAMFDSTNGTPNMCSALQRSSLTIQRTVAEIQAKGIDGVNVDYESNNTTCTEPGTGIVASSQSLFTTFVKNLRAALPAGSYLSVDTYSGAAGYRDTSGAYLGFFDIGGLANYADSFFVMAYDMEYANWDSPPLSCPTFCIGPTAPLSTYLFNDSRASAEYRAVVPASKIIMGIPYYGRKECVAVPDPNQIPPNAQGTSVAADGYLDAQAENGYTGNTLYVAHREARDPLSATRWDTFSSTTAGCNREMYWDDATALGNKYNLVINDHLRGAGIFALNYGGGAPELWDLINLKFGQCSQAAISADKTVPQIPGTPITFTSSALCAGTAQFRFLMQAPGAGSFTQVQGYGASNTLAWNTTGQPVGTYQFRVEARNLGSTVAYDTYAVTSFRLALCVTPTMSTDLAAPQLPGTPVTFTSAVTCQGTPEYRYWLLVPGGTWTIVQDYTPSATFRWDTTHLAYGDYDISVHVRTAGTTVPYESYSSIPYSLRSCIAPSLSTDKASPQPTGTTVALGGTATCDGTPQYRFMIQPPGGAWTVVQDFKSSTSYTWVGGGPGGTYNLELDARSLIAPAGSMTSTQLAYTLASCTAATLAPSPSSPQIPGTAVLMTATSTCPGTAQYRFTVKSPNLVSTVVQPYGSASTYDWITIGLARGAYSLMVDVRNVGATSASEAGTSAVFTLANPPCDTPTISSDFASPQGAGSIITFSASTTTCPTPLFRFSVLAPNSVWTLMQDYSTSRTFAWHATVPGGTYRIQVDVRDSTRPVSFDQYSDVWFVITACSGATVAPSVPSPQASGTQILFTASATGCPNPRYQFWILTPGHGWQIVQPYSSMATFNWNTTNLPQGGYLYTVWARDATSTGASCGSLGCEDAYSPGTSYTLNTQPCTSVTDAPALASPQASGTTLTFTATASGCPHPLYQFWVLAPSHAWQVAQAYSSNATFNWDTTGLRAGNYLYTVWARDVSSVGTSCGSVGCEDAYSPGVAYMLTTQPCTSVTDVPSPATPQASGTNVTFTANTSGCPHPLYQFWILAPGHAWQIAQSYSAAATLNWTTTGAPAGNYLYTVWARDSGSTGTSCGSLGCEDTYSPGTNFALTKTPCTSVTDVASPGSPQTSGTAITFTASAAGCTHPLYQFWILAPGHPWQIAQAYSPSATLNWTTTGLPAGSYLYTVWVRDSGSNGTSCGSLGCEDAYFPGTAYKLS
jgi:spore germination protein YaaH